MALDSGIKNRLILSIEKMPSLPTTVGKVIELANDINSSAKDILAVIQMDPVLTAKVLKLINSAFFALPNKVSLKQAVVLLGINTIKNLALSSAIIGQMAKNKIMIKNFDQHRFWEHSLGTGIASRLICKKLNPDPQTAEEFFVAGLVHDIGKLVLALAVPAIFSKTIQVAKEKGLTSWDAESQIIGIDHAEVGSMLAQKWALRESLINSTRYHHYPADNQNQLTWVIHLANTYVNQKGYSNSDDSIYEKRNEGVYDYLGLSENEIGTILESLPEEIEKASIFLQSDRSGE
ncbi:MAG TPA: HDOD domain-containing protein [archaeon]|nr:HDOD domain-containing protein [archaeon]